MRRILSVLTHVAALSCCAVAAGQAATSNAAAAGHVVSAAQAPSAAKPTVAPQRLRLFLSCPLECFDDFLRQELNYFDFVRDPHEAEVTVMIVRQRAANGGERFTVTFAHSQPTKAKQPDGSQSFTAAFGQTASVTRTQLVQVILRMLQVELAGTPDAAAFELRLPRRDGAALSKLHDDWDYWVISPEVRAKASGGSGFYVIDMSGALTLRRVTEESKVRMHGAYLRKLSSFRLEDGSRINGDIDGMYGRALYAHSIGGHWALGAVASAMTERYGNFAWHLHGGPLIEFNVFPYTDNASQQLRVAYQAGAWAARYFELNRDGKKHQLLPYHALSVVAESNQTWGSVQWVGQLNSFITQPKLYRLSTGAIINLRLFEGFAVGVQGTAALVSDQINLRQRTITDNEIVLWTAEQPTDHTFEVEFFLSYAFGSTHNTIVNPRFARVDLEDD